MIFLFLLCAALSAASIWYVLRYNLHMFQLNTYMNGEQITWLRGNWKREAVIAVPAVLSVLSALLLGKGLLVKTAAAQKEGKLLSFLLTGGRSGARLVFGLLLLVLLAAVLGFTVYYFRFLKRYLTKKKLVFTNRVKRQAATALVLCAAGILLCGRLFGAAGALAAANVLCMLLPVMILLVNLINHPMEKAVNRYYLNDCRRLLAENPDLVIIGITGSYGKTSVKYYLQTLLQDHFNLLITPGNFNTPLGITRTVRSSLRPTHEVFLCEMGARYVGEIKEICDLVHPDHGIITSIGPQHLETFGGIEQVISTKFELADALPEGGMLFVNGDNEYIRGQIAKYPGAVRYQTQVWADAVPAAAASMRPQPAAAENPASLWPELSAKPAAAAETGRSAAYEDYYATEISVSSRGTDFTVTAPSGETERFSMHLIGRHNVINVLGAIAVAHKLGISLPALKVPVRRLEPVEHRMQIKPGAAATIIDDAYNSNPIGSRAAVETLAMFDGVRILVTPGMVELGEQEEEYNYKFGTYATGCCDHIVLVGPKHTEPIYRGAVDAGFPENRIAVFGRIEEAMQYVYAIKDHGHKYILLENDLPDNY